MINKNRIRFENTSKGVSIWVDDRWVLDASVFKETGEFNIDRDRMSQTSASSFKYKYSQYNKELMVKIKRLEAELEDIKERLE